MVNPFDRNFFKFFVGFIVILILSFVALYFVQSYGGAIDNAAASILF